jgi:hypothetical protein
MHLVTEQFVTVNASTVRRRTTVDFLRAVVRRTVATPVERAAKDIELATQPIGLVSAQR